MQRRTVPEAIFRLGQLSYKKNITNIELIRRITHVAADTIGTDVTGLAVYEHGIENAANACCIVGPWTKDESAKFLDMTRWAMEDRVLAARLVHLERNRMYKRSEIVSEEEFRTSRMYNEFHKPLGLGDQAVGVYRRVDGAELVFCINSMAAHGPIPREAFKRAAELGIFLGHCWAMGWRREPAWMANLKPQTRQVLEGVLAGCDDEQIAERTGLTYHSVRAHLKRLFRESHVRSRLHLMQVCRETRGVPLIQTNNPFTGHDSTLHAPVSALPRAASGQAPAGAGAAPMAPAAPAAGRAGSPTQWSIGDPSDTAFGLPLAMSN